MKDGKRGLEVGLWVPGEILGSLADQRVEVRSQRYGDLRVEGQTPRPPGVHFKFLSINQPEDRLLAKSQKDTVFITVGTEVYQFVSGIP